MNKLPKGLWPVMLTPFREDNSVDTEGLIRLTEFYIGAGADGLFANCLSSEMFQLTDRERLEVTQTVIQTAAGRVPVISTGSFSTDMNSTAALAKKLRDLGAAAVVISTNQPCTELEGEKPFRSRMEELMHKTDDIPLGLYECPVPYKRLVPPPLLKWLADTGRFLYHKDTSCELESIREKIAVTANTPLGIYNAHVPTAVDSILAGARGISPIGANLYPELFTYLLRQVGRGETSESVMRLKAMLDMLDSIIHVNYPFVAKLFLQRRGLKISTRSRKTRLSFTTHDLGKLDTVMQVFNELTDEFEIERFEFQHV
ncbi:MAG: dihydrodipicolinate synthase family protein [Lewinella sp.]